MPVNTQQAIDLRCNNGLSYEQIAKIQGVSKVAVFKKIKHLLPTDETEAYKNHRADMLAHMQLRLLSQLTDERIKKMQGRDLIVSTGILYDKERLERGQSTGNFAMITANIAELVKARREADNCG